MEKQLDTKWIKIEDESEYAIVHRHKIILDDGRPFIIGIHPVLFGYRVVGYFEGDNGFELNWCCGDNKIVLFATQKIIMNLLEQGTKLFDIPFGSDIKPWTNDKEFIEKISKLVKNPVFADIVAVMDGTRPEI